MQQLLLNLNLNSEPTLDSYIVGNNKEVMCTLRQIADKSSSEKFVYIWGEPATGKTHILKSLAQDKSAKLLIPNNSIDEFCFDEAYTIYLLDDCHLLSPDQQIAAFDLFNQIRANHQAFMVSAGNCIPQELPLRSDLKSRLAWGLIFRIKTLSDDEKVVALSEYAKQHGFNLQTNVLNYLMTHFQRDMHSLSAIMLALDHYSLETKRVITIPLLHDLLEKHINEH